MNRIRSLTIIPSVLIVACSIEKKFEKSNVNEPAQNYCPYDIEAASDADSFISSIESPWKRGTRTKVTEEGMFKDTYYSAGLELLPDEKSMNDLKFRYPNATQDNHSLTESLTGITYDQLIVSAPVAGDEGQDYRLLVFHKAKSNGREYDCVAMAMKLDEASHQPELLVRGLELHSAQVQGTAPTKRAAADYFKEKGSPNRYQRPGTKAATPSPIPTASPTPTRQPDPATIRTISLDNAPYYHVTTIVFDPKNITSLSAPVEITLSCDQDNYSKTFTVADITATTVKKSGNYTQDFGRCKSLEYEVRQGSKIRSGSIDHRKLWKELDDVEGQIEIDIHEYLK